MAKDRIFFRKLAYVNRRTRVPENSLWFQCLWICILILWGSYTQLLDYVIYSSMIFYAITIFGIFKMRKMGFEEKNVFKVPSFVPVTFLVLALFIIISLTVYRPLYTVPGLLITFVGVFVYNFWNKKK